MTFQYRQDHLETVLVRRARYSRQSNKGGLRVKTAGIVNSWCGIGVISGSRIYRLTRQPRLAILTLQIILFLSRYPWHFPALKFSPSTRRTRTSTQLAKNTGLYIVEVGENCALLTSTRRVKFIAIYVTFETFLRMSNDTGKALMRNLRHRFPNVHCRTTSKASPPISLTLWKSFY